MSNIKYYVINIMKGNDNILMSILNKYLFNHSNK